MKKELTGDKLPIDSLAALDQDNSLLMLGVVPLVIVVVIGILFLVLNMYRRSKNWNELGEAMRLDDGDQPVKDTDFDKNFSTQNISKLDPTVPAKRLDDTRDPSMRK
jgi:hypothetical protein